jgi:hypothetical protein
MQSPLRAIELSSNAEGSIALSSMALTREMVVSSLLEKPSNISSLSLISQPFNILSEGIPLALEYLTSLELRCTVWLVPWMPHFFVGSVHFFTFDHLR